MGFTDHDRSFTYNDIFYESQAGYNRTALSGDAGYTVDNADVTGFFDSTNLNEQDLRNGVYNFANIYVFLVNWMDLTQGEIKLRRGWFGEVTVTSDGQFTVELRGMAQALSHTFVENFTPECRADFCDARCTLKLADYTHVGTVTNIGDGFTTFSASALPPAPTTSTSVGAHKTWAINPETIPDATHIEIAEIRFWDQEGNLITGGTPGSYAHDSGHAAAKARDGDINTTWAATDTFTVDANGNPTTTTTQTALGSRWFIAFDTAVDVKEVEVIASSLYGSAPTALTLQYTDDMVVTDTQKLAAEWNTGKECTYEWTAGGQSAQWGIGTETSDPINVASTLIDLPTPFVGASLYNGGAIDWQTGRNAGASMEITGFVVETNTIELFEGMHYSINIGDTFLISQGCDKSAPTCTLYKNILNFRGEPHVPGQDQYLSYPDATVS